MNCKDLESIIYLFDESTEEEKVRLARHLEHCTACATKYKSVVHTISLVKKNYPTPAAAFPRVMQARIMKRIGDESGRTQKGWLPQLVFMPALRLGFAALSVFIVGLFCYELSVTPSQPVRLAPEKSSAQVSTSETLKTLSSSRQGREVSVLRNLKKQQLSLTN